jgi:lipopolysaccharide export LptBFGC system permease protein LptF
LLFFFNIFIANVVYINPHNPNNNNNNNDIKKPRNKSNYNKYRFKNNNTNNDASKFIYLTNHPTTTTIMTPDNENRIQTEFDELKNSSNSLIIKNELMIFLSILMVTLIVDKRDNFLSFF